MHSCVKVYEAIKLPFGVANGVDSGIGDLDGGAHPQREGEVLRVFLYIVGLSGALVLMAFFSSFVRERMYSTRA